MNTSGVCFAIDMMMIKEATKPTVVCRRRVIGTLRARVVALLVQGDA